MLGGFHLGPRSFADRVPKVVDALVALNPALLVPAHCSGVQAAQARLHGEGYLLCPHCDHEVEKDFLRCPSCLRKLKDACGNCAKPLDPDWKICPYCEAEIPGKTPMPRRRRRRTEETAVAEPNP